MSYAYKKTYACAVATDKPMAKIIFISFLISLWVLATDPDMGWVMTLILIAPTTFLVGMGIAFVLEYFIEPLLRWIKK